MQLGLKENKYLVGRAPHYLKKKMKLHSFTSNHVVN